MLLAFGLIPILLLLIGALPEQLQRTWRLQTDSWTVVTLYFSNFVHTDIQHLSHNVIAYLAVMSALFPLALLTERVRRLFWATLAFLTVVPFVVSSASVLLAPTPRTVLGFSGVTAAFVGLLPVFINTFVRAKLCEALWPGLFAAWLMTAGLGAVLLLTAGFHRRVLSLLGVLGFGLLVLILSRLRSAATIEHASHVALLLYATAVFLTVQVSLFVTVSANVDFYGHLAGLLTGFLVGVLLSLVEVYGS